MKLPLTTALSIAGVLAAGVAAAAVNTQALQSRANSTVGEATASLVVDASPSQDPTSSAVPVPTQTEIQYVYENSGSTSTPNADESSTDATPKATPTHSTRVKTTTDNSVPADPANLDPNQPTAPNMQDEEDDDSHEFDSHEEDDELD